jgi:predicted RNase H-like HicB family nuclease
MSTTDYATLPYTKCFVPEDNGYSCYVKELHGCMSQGDTLDEAYRNLGVAMHNWIEAAQLLGQDIPVPNPDFWEREVKGASEVSR